MPASVLAVAAWPSSVVLVPAFLVRVLVQAPVLVQVQVQVQALAQVAGVPLVQVGVPAFPVPAQAPVVVRWSSQRC